MARELFGDHVRPTYDTDPTLQPELFTQAGGTGSAWMRAAEEWAASHRVVITAWHCDQTFHCGSWHFWAHWKGDRWEIDPAWHRK